MSGRRFDRFVVFAVMRSGSNLLERFLSQYEGLACHGELFNPIFIGRTGQTRLFNITVDQRRKDPNALLNAIDAALPEQINGLRYFPAHDPAAMDVLLNDPRCAKIILTRDPLHSFVSQLIAEYSDIWLIGSEKDRLPVAVPVALDAFRRYEKQRDDFLARIRDGLAASGQQAFEIDYDELLDIGKVNKLALAIGADAPLATLSQPIKRQNPGPLSAKISNYAEIHAALGLPAPNPLQSPQVIKPADNPAQWVWPRHYYTCDDLPLAFAPLLASPKQPIVAWLDLLPGKVHTGHHLQHVQAWQKFHNKARVISVLHHPLDRAYDVFMSKIFSTAPDAFIKIRRSLERGLQVYLPENSRIFSRKEYTIDDHRTAFQQFLVFVAANLRGETDIRQDGNWRPQADLVDIFAEIMPINTVIKTADLDGALTALEQALDLPPSWARLQRYPHARPVYTLDDIYDAQTEALARSTYPQDYARFEFENWAPGQAAFDASLPVRIS